MAKQKEEKVGSEKILEDLEKKFGLSVAKIKDIDVTSTGSYMLNIATGINGHPKGKVIEMFGPESSGKSTVAYHAIAEFQRAQPDKKVFLFDYENSFDKKYGKSLGVDVDALKIYQPDNQEQGYDMILAIADKGIASLIIIDSHTAAIPKAIIEGEMSDATYALAARNNSKFLGNVKGKLTRTNTTLIGISQLRSDVKSGPGSGDKPSGGNAWKFYADMRYKIWKSAKLEDEMNVTTVDVVKNKCAPPFGKAVFNIAWGTGVDTYKEILDLAVESKIVEKSGSWYSRGDVKLGQGAEKVTQMFKDNPEYFNELRDTTLESLKEKPFVPEEAPEGDPDTFPAEAIIMEEEMHA